MAKNVREKNTTFSAETIGPLVAEIAALGLVDQRLKQRVLTKRAVRAKQRTSGAG